MKENLFQKAESLLQQLQDTFVEIELEHHGKALKRTLPAMVAGMLLPLHELVRSRREVFCQKYARYAAGTQRLETPEETINRVISGA